MLERVKRMLGWITISTYELRLIKAKTRNNKGESDIWPILKTIPQ